MEAGHEGDSVWYSVHWTELGLSHKRVKREVNSGGTQDWWLYGFVGLCGIIRVS